jgi:hypothetical protein
MRNIFAIAITVTLASTVPALAQQAGEPGSIGSVGGLSGHNTPGSAGNSNGANDNGAYRGDGPMGEGRASAPDVDGSYDAAPRSYRGTRPATSIRTITWATAMAPTPGVDRFKL